LGAGTTFCFTLPLEIADEPEHVENEGHEKSKAV
jgi:hypothetical protein